MQVIAALPWLVVPIVMLALLIWAVRILVQTDDPSLKTSAVAGFWARLIICVVFIVSRLGEFQDVNFSFSSVPGIDTHHLLIGIAIGFFVTILFAFLLPTRLVGIFTMLLVGSSSTTLVAFVLLSSSRFAILYLALGTALGIFLNAMIMPDTFRRAWNVDEY